MEHSVLTSTPLFQILKRQEENTGMENPPPPIQPALLQKLKQKQKDTGQRNSKL